MGREWVQNYYTVVFDNDLLNTSIKASTDLRFLIAKYAIVGFTEVE